MTNNILEKIIRKKEEKILNLKKTIDLNYLEENKNKINNFVDFKQKIEINLKNNKFSIIAEIKKGSPSAGIIIKAYAPIKLAKIYENYKATCLSILLSLIHI